MNYEFLSDFIDNKMRMSHIYQPVMLIELLSNGGTLRDALIAKALLTKDDSQIEYYTHITNNMVGRVLRNRSVVVRNNQTREYSLVGFANLNDSQISSLIQKCLRRLDGFLEKRGKNVFDHRRRSSGYISGTIRYEVLKRAKFHCELCGISAFEKAIEIDHIVPRNCGGSDDLSNLQALCYSCNSMKRDTDDTDFREVRESFHKWSLDCAFCNPERERVVLSNQLAFSYRDAFPVSGGHTLIIPKRHVSSFFELGQSEINACTSLLNQQKNICISNDESIDGFNVGVNVGETAGQTIMHCHIHLIPRRRGDVADPIGGVRNTIPGKGNYRTAR